MPVDVSPSRRALEGNPGAASLVKALDDNEDTLDLQNAAVYVDFPIYRDPEGGLVTPQFLLLSSRHGVAIFGLTAAVRWSPSDMNILEERVEGELQHIYGRLLASKVLPKTRTTLDIPVNAAIYAPHLAVDGQSQHANVLAGAGQLLAFLNSVATDPLKPEYLSEIEALIQGTKGLRNAEAT